MIRGVRESRNLNEAGVKEHMGVKVIGNGVKGVRELRELKVKGVRGVKKV